MKKEKSVTVILISVILVVILSINPIVNAAKNKGDYWIVTDGDTNPELTHKSYTDLWTGQEIEERNVLFEWYIYYNNNIVSVASQGWKVGGVKAECTVYSSGKDLYLYIRPYKGGLSSSKVSETFVWKVVDGKDSTNNQFNFVFTSIDTGRMSKTVTLNIGEERIVGLPCSSSYSCRMWLT